MLYLRLALNKSLLNSKMPFDNIIHAPAAGDAETVKQMRSVDVLGGTSKWHY